MVALLVCKYMSTNTISLLIESGKPISPPTLICKFSFVLREALAWCSILHSWESLPNPDASPPKTESGLAELFTEIRSTVDQEAQIVKFVFPNPPFVMQVFLQRVFAQSVCNKFLPYIL